MSCANRCGKSARNDYEVVRVARMRGQQTENAEVTSGYKYFVSDTPPKHIEKSVLRGTFHEGCLH